MLLTMLQDSPGKTVKQVLVDDFSRVSPASREEICKVAKVNPNMKAETIHGEDVERLHKALGEVKVMAPPATARRADRRRAAHRGPEAPLPTAEFYVVDDASAERLSRQSVRGRGRPRVRRRAAARRAGGDHALREPRAAAIPAEGVRDQRERLRHELESATSSRSRRARLPVGPLAIVVHLASVWVPFTSEAKEAVAHYDELLKEMRLALQECGRKLGTHLRARAKARAASTSASRIFQRYIPEVSRSRSATSRRATRTKIEKIFYKALPNFVNVRRGRDAIRQLPPAPARRRRQPGAAPRRRDRNRARREERTRKDQPKVAPDQGATARRRNAASSSRS